MKMISNNQNSRYGYSKPGVSQEAALPAVFCSRCSFEHTDIFSIIDFDQNALVRVDQQTAVPEKGCPSPEFSQADAAVNDRILSPGLLSEQSLL